VKYTVLAVIIGMVVSLSTMSIPSFAQTQTHSELIPIDGALGLEKTILTMNIPTDNTLPWGYVEGTIANHASGYPVIIQMYKDGEAAHFAQTSVNEDGSYEYKFRVLDVNNDRTIKLFTGEYTVKIFKVIYLNPDSISV